jgi:hypothetical protein
MKNKIIVLGTVIAGIFLFTSCLDDFLTKEPKNLISEANVWGNGGDSKAIIALMANYYDNIPYNCGAEVGEWGEFLSQLCDESMRGYVWGAPYTPTMTSAIQKYGGWDYNRIRDINDFLERIVETDMEDKDLLTAEAYFIRAFHYFKLAKCYGGVPILDRTQAYNPDNFDELKAPRNTEEEVWNFVAQDADRAIEYFNRYRGTYEAYRVNKYAAFALKSRAMLYAGAIAKYGAVQLNGLVGVPATSAQRFLELSLAAADSIITSGKYSLYDRGGNSTDEKAANFQNLFLDKTMHEEAIVIKYFQGPKFGSFDYFNAATSYKVNWGCATNPTLELVEAFEYRDGKPGTLEVYDGAGASLEYDKPEDLFYAAYNHADKDPRFFATVLYPGCPWQGSTVEIRQGIVTGGSKLTASSFATPRPDGNGFIVGKDGLITGGDCSETGFYIKKFMDPVNKLDLKSSETPWLAMRYGEVLLNYAEAAVELGVQPAKALECINKIRTRAGIPEKTALTLDDVRHERRVELAFENHRFWDIRRWRIGATLMNNTKFHGLYPWLNVDNDKYIFETDFSAHNLPKTFREVDYYLGIPGISANEKLVQNPGY